MKQEAKESPLERRVRMGHLQRRDIQRRLGELAFGRHPQIATDIGVAAMGAGKKAGARRGADRSARIVLGEKHSRGGKGIDIGSLDELLSVASQISPTQVVGYDEDHIRLLICFFLLGASGYGATGRQKSSHFNHCIHITFLLSILYHYL